MTPWRTLLVVWWFAYGHFVAAVAVPPVEPSSDNASARALQTVDGNVLVAVSTTRLDRLLVLIAFTDEEDVLQDTNNVVTVLGPVDEALEIPELSRLNLLNYRKMHLPDFVRTHILEESVSVDEMVGSSITTKSGEAFAVSRSGDTTITLSNSLGSSTITTANIQANNGFLHVLDTALRPTWFGWNVAQVASTEYSIFADLLVSTLYYDQVVRNTDNTFTFLAPANSAVEGLPAGIWDRVQASPTYAESFVRAHFIENIYTNQDLRQAIQLFSQVDESPFFLWNMEPSGTDFVTVNGNLLVNLDKLAYNGIVHIMNGVFLPFDGPPPLTTTLVPSSLPTDMPSILPTTQSPTQAPSSGAGYTSSISLLGMLLPVMGLVAIPL